MNGQINPIKTLEEEWKALFIEAIKAGISKDEIREFLLQTKNPTVKKVN